MMLKQTAVLLIAIFALFILAACSPAASPVGSIDSLVEEGILMGPGTVLPPARPNLTQAVRDSFYQQLSIPVNLNFPNSHVMSFERERMGRTNELIRTILYEYGHYSGVCHMLRYGQGFITEGDFIAELTFDPPQTIIVDIFELEMERDFFEATFAEERQNRLQEIENMRIALEVAPDGEWELIALRLKLAELRLQQFLYSAIATRANFENRMEALRLPFETERLYSPISGMIVSMWWNDRAGPFRNIPLDWNNTRTIMTIHDTYSFSFFAEAPLHALRYGDIVPLLHHETGDYFYAMVATDPMTFGIWREGNHWIPLIPLEGEIERFTEEVDIDTADIRQLNWRLGGLLAQPVIPIIHDGILVDARAVVTENLRHYVTIYNDGNFSKRYVTLGLRTGVGPGAQIQILTGLEAGQWVVIP